MVFFCICTTEIKCRVPPRGLFNGECLAFGIQNDEGWTTNDEPAGSPENHTVNIELAMNHKKHHITPMGGIVLEIV